MIGMCFSAAQKTISAAGPTWAKRICAVSAVFPPARIVVSANEIQEVGIATNNFKGFREAGAFEQQVALMERRWQRPLGQA